MALQADGKVLVGGSLRLFGSQKQFEFARLNSDGTFDTGFLIPGTDVVHLGNITAFAVQTDGKILANEVNTFGQRRLVRLNSDGTYDNTFAFELSGGGVQRIVLQSDGKIIVTGLVPDNSSKFAPIARLNANGSLDTTFNSGTGPGSVIQSLLLQPDGKIVIAGAILNGGTKRLARLNANGSLDTTFAAALPYTNLAVGALALQPDGKVFVGMDFS